MHMSTFRQQQLKNQGTDHVQYQNQTQQNQSVYKKKGDQIVEQMNSSMRVRKGSTNDYERGGNQI